MPVVHTVIFIARSPAECREIFLDFPAWPTWHTSFLKTIKPQPPTPSTVLSVADLQGSSALFTPGKKVLVELTAFGLITPILLSNSPHALIWRGGNHWVGFQGDHAFHFEAAEQDGVPGTRMVHEEVFSGFLSWVIGTNWLASWIGIRGTTEKGFWEWTRDFGRRCEGGEGEGRKGV